MKAALAFVTSVVVASRALAARQLESVSFVTIFIGIRIAAGYGVRTRQPP